MDPGKPPGFEGDTAPPRPDPASIILNSVLDLVVLANPKGISLWVSPSSRRLIGHYPHELVDRTFFGIVHPEDIERFREAFEDCAASGRAALLRIRMQNRDGGICTFDTQLSPARNDAGEVEHVVLVHREAIDAAKPKTSQHGSDMILRTIVENAAELILVTDPNGKQLYSTSSSRSVLGYQPGEIQDTWDPALIHEEDRQITIDAIQEAIAVGTRRIIHYRMRHKDGSWRTIESQNEIVRDARGEIEYLLFIADDITERKASEDERKQMEIQLRHAQKMESIGQLAAGIAHEINTPTQYIGDNIRFLKEAFDDANRVLVQQDLLLQAIKSKSDLTAQVLAVEEAIQSVDLPYLMKEIPGAINQSLEGVQRVASIVQAMKEFSHPGTNEKALIDLNRSIESTLTVCRNEWKYVADMVTQFDSSLPLVRCLPGEINQTILNVVVNATHAIIDVVGDASKGRGTITVSTRRDGDWVEIRVQDTGTGIPEHARTKVFDPFFTTKGVGKGTGQGMAIAHSVVVDKHGGTIRFETAMGKGTTFIIRLPLNQDSTAMTHKAA